MRHARDVKGKHGILRIGQITATAGGDYFATGQGLRHPADHILFENAPSVS